MLLACGDARGAADAALAGMDPTRPVPNNCEWLLPLAARALADLCEQARDAGADPDEQLARVDALVGEHPRVIRDLVSFTPQYLVLLAGLDALYEAEVERARTGLLAAERWCGAVEALAAAGLRWEEAYAAWRAAEALWRGAPGAAERRRAAASLRRARAIALRLRATPLLASIDAVGRAARISLVAVDAVGPGDAAAGGLAVLTRREREVVAHVVAGRTYPEIAGALFLSEKTVSSHISNVLRKTGTANRVELAAWAERQGGR